MRSGLHILVTVYVFSLFKEDNFNEHHPLCSSTIPHPPASPLFCSSGLMLFVSRLSDFSHVILIFHSPPPPSSHCRKINYQYHR